MPNHTLHRILYIEDDVGLARLLQKRLEREHFTVDITHSAEQGLVMMDEADYDLVLVDYHLPGINGLELLDLLATRDDTPPIVILTVGGDERVAVSALEKGAADYAVKDAGQNYFDLLPAIMQAAFMREALVRENERQRQELSDAKEKAEAANTAKSNFLATMSHEIRTPLNVVTGLTAVLARTTLDEKQTKIVSTLSSNAQLLLKLINDLLDISRIEAGHVMLESTRFSFSAVLEDTRLMFEQHAQQKNIALHFDDQTHGRAYIGDRTRVQQIAMNLVSNAIKFTDQGGVDVVARPITRADGQHCIQLTVRDTGIGIAPEHLPTIFNTFTQADATITRRFGGSGLGLSIAHSLARMMDGDIGIESEAGKGSLFTATICLTPCEACEAVVEPASAAAAAKPESSDALGAEVLLVEDYAPNIMVATMMLEDMGYRVESAENGTKAMALVQARSAPFMVILMDVQMQGVDGLETTRRIREIEQEKGFRHTIIGVTAHALAGDRERCLSAGMDDYISKPIHPDILAAKLQQLA
ncbi:MAG: response regulator [Rickettsiales bacterium]